MFEAISDQLDAVFRKLRLKGRLTEANISEAMREIRRALLEADVNFRIVKDFVEKVKSEALGQEVLHSISPGQQIVKIVHDRLVELMGPVDHSIPYASKGPTIIVMAGLQGSGKTTTCGKLALYVRKKGHHPMLVAADVKRPAAREQLQVLGANIDVPVYTEAASSAPVVCSNAVNYGLQIGADVLILDTAGRLHIDPEMMEELKEIVERVKPHQVYLVCDAMTGQDAVNSASRFNEELPLDAVILTKLDGDARGGAALSVKAVTGKPIKFVGVGEKLDEFEEFHPERMAGRILGMGDVVSLVEKAQATFEKEQAQKLQEKLLKKTFTLADFLEQLQRVKKMGPIGELLSMVPGFGKQLQGFDLDEKELLHIEAIIQSMTPRERQRPEIIDASRRQRIARGSGTTMADVGALLKQFKQMKSLMKRMMQPAGGPFPAPLPFGGGFRHGRGKRKRR